MTRALWLTKPTGLSAAALEYWKYYAGGLSKVGTLRPETAESFKMLCRLLATAQAAAEQIEKFGVTAETGSGSRKPNPACAVLFRAQEQAAPLLPKFDLD